MTNKVTYTSETKLSLMVSSLVFTNNNNVTTIIELNDFSNLHSWKRSIYSNDVKVSDIIGYEYGTTITLNIDVDIHRFSINGGKQQIVVSCGSEELRDELNNKIYSFLYFNNFIKSKKVYLKNNKNEQPNQIPLFNIFDVDTSNSSKNILRIIYPDYSKSIELPSEEDVLNFGSILKQISDLYIKTRDVMFEEDMVSLSRKVETLKQFPFIIY